MQLMGLDWEVELELIMDFLVELWSVLWETHLEEYVPPGMHLLELD